jgi:uncharacterized protein YacL
MPSPIEEIESSAADALRSANEAAQQCCQRCEEKIRAAPIASVLSALGVGYVLRIAPIAILVTGLLRIGLVLLRPAILIFGTLKLIEFFKNQSARPLDKSLGSAATEPLVNSPIAPPPL